MKITKFLVLSFLLFAFTATSFPEAVHAKDPEAVIDVNGNEVRAGVPYVIVAASTDKTTTLAVTANTRIICRSDVILSPLHESLPITFSTVIKSNDSVIREGTYLNLNFYAPACLIYPDPTMWKIEFRPRLRGFIVTTMGVDRLNRFKITKYEGDNRFYQLSFCPMSEPLCDCSCVPLGKLGKLGNHLAPGANPLPFVFEPDASTAPKIEYKMMSE